jgi:hypothetical protein
MPQITKPEPFTIHLAEEVLTDLRERLARTRWPGEIPDSGWEYGTHLAYLQELIQYWRTRYDWRAQERALNQFQHYRATVDGAGIHFIHERGRGPKPLPLIIIHGWPGSFYEFVKMIRRWPIRSASAVIPPTPLTSSSRRCPVTDFPTPRASVKSTSSESPTCSLV